MNLTKYSLGIGDRFGHQGAAQLAALQQAGADGVAITPVWNKSNREHVIIGTDPMDARREADAAVATRGWTAPYFVNADHINLNNVDRFLAAADFFTLDVADCIGTPAPAEALAAFITAQHKYAGELAIPGIAATFPVTDELLQQIGGNYLHAVQESARIYRHIAAAKAATPFVVEVSMDETTRPQTPVELFFILAMLAAEGVSCDTIAPKFTGEFHKGVDYLGDVARFTREFTEDLAVIDFAVKEFGLPAGLKLSVHSGSDKFSLYGPIRHALSRFNAGVHLKTAGTTWLEEVIGLALSGTAGLALARDIYRRSLAQYDVLIAPYAAVIAIDTAQLPTPEDVAGWSSEQFAAALRHDQRCPSYNPNFRQLIHVGYKVAADMGREFTDALEANAEIIGEQVTENLYARHIRPLFLG